MLVLLKKDGSRSLPDDQIVIPRPPDQNADPEGYKAWRQRWGDVKRLLEAAAARLRQGTGQACDQVELQGRTERVVVAASAQADVLIVARDGDQARLGPKSLGRATRFVVDHAACPVLLACPGMTPGIASMPPPPPPPHHPSPPGR